MHYFRVSEPRSLIYSDLGFLFEHKVSARQFSKEKADALMPGLAHFNVEGSEKLRSFVEHLE